MGARLMQEQSMLTKKNAELGCSVLRTTALWLTERVKINFVLCDPVLTVLFLNLEKGQMTWQHSVLRLMPFDMGICHLAAPQRLAV